MTYATASSGTKLATVVLWTQTLHHPSIGIVTNIRGGTTVSTAKPRWLMRGWEDQSLLAEHKVRIPGTRPGFLHHRTLQAAFCANATCTSLIRGGGEFLRLI
ncbi:unnamed protein product [Pleuronectes platessa]|uniref:Uncharacterized protein n=1 Tax=Pleuronectes platessa TaxID=8262 RepID=A0A9N7Z8K9_PLEPL|nr:unnamed protein product [Pleuronectes platessa]